MTRNFPFALLLLATLAGCGATTGGGSDTGGTSAGDVIGSCTFSDDGYCVIYGSEWTVDQARDACEGYASATFSESTCSSTDAVGECTRQDGVGNTIVEVFYASHYSDEAFATQTCEALGGTYTLY